MIIDLSGSEMILLRFAAVSVAIFTVWKLWLKPIKNWIILHTDTAEIRLLNIERQLVVSNGRATTIESRVNENHDLLMTHIAETAPLVKMFIEEHTKDKE